MPSVERSRKLTATIELVAFVTIALISKEVADLFAGPYSGPVSLIATLVLLTFYMQRRGESWTSMGLCALPGTKAKLLLVPQAILVFIAVLAIISFVTFGFETLGMDFMSETPEGEKERWGVIEGNLGLYLTLIALSWISAGFGEEMFFRGFVITRLQSALGGINFTSALSVLLSALLFGYVHFYYQGLTGFVNAGIIGVIFGTFFLVYKRNLWPLVLAHGSINSLGFTSEFMGWGL